MQIITLPLNRISADAFPRDRTHLDSAEQADLVASILRDGLRQPIEVVGLSEPLDGCTHALVSGMRRLTALREIARMNGTADTATAPAFLRAPPSMAAILRDIAVENEQRAPVSMFEKGRFLIESVAQGHFDTLDAAISGLFPEAARNKAYRLRAAAEVAQALDGQLSTPEALSQNQIEALAMTLRRGMGLLVDEVLKLHRARPLSCQMQALKPLLAEAATVTEAEAEITRRTGHPRRLLHLPQGLTLRREQTAKGWLLHFSGPEARSGALLDDVFRLIEQNCLPKQ